MRTLPDLPVTAALPALLKALENQGKAVLVAPPGAGKTTLAPLALLDAPWLGAGKILLLEPRRLAARAAARRMAELLGEEVGGTVGYAMRMERRVSAATRILVVTEGVLARTVLDDPELPGISAILFDEFHERSLDGDFGLALALDVQGALRPDLRLLVMSATLDGARVAKLLGDAPVIESQGRSFPVEIRYDERPAGMPVEDAMARAIRDALVAEPGSVLAFLPGQREIERTAERLEGRLGTDVDIAPLYGMLDGKAQDAAIKPARPGRRKVVLATSIAETSITIDGVRVVIDSGLSRLPKYEPATGLTRLETVRVSRASADQRAGRAGRTQPGVAIRLWRAEQTAALPAFTPPEILEADLSSLVLDCAAFGVADPSSLAFLDPPPAPALAEARALLADLDAIDPAGRLTPAGEAMRKLALPVRLAHMVAEAAKDDHALPAAELAVLVTERGLGGDSVDLERRLIRFRSEHGPRATAARQLAERLARQAERSRIAPHPYPLPVKNGERESSTLASPSPRPSRGEGKGEGRRGLPDNPTTAGALLIHAWPDRVAKARGARGRFVLANGSGAMLDAANSLSGEAFLVVADLQGKAQNARIAAAAPISVVEIREALGARIVKQVDSSFDPEKRAVRVRETERLGAIVFSERMLPPPTGAEADRAILDALRAHGLALLPLSRETETLRHRLQWLHRGLGAPWPDVSEEALLASLDDWLAPFLRGEASFQRIDAGILHAGLMSLAPHELQRRIASLAPTHFDAPSGSRIPIRYDGEWPVLAIRVQELFGLDSHPSIVGGTVPLTLELLSPAHRPIQTTRDLPGFWRGSWADVRADMRGRYPKHVWPEDPISAEATARAKPRVK
ncbi:ATP-dependent helicase HrpB [Allomesorhizobium alhagi]|uniref:ATP-dependent helicase HrpB n=1 Tax=Mesorhizobium alhagi CCNWXJ12-2 TaxID=1107882 RepID=H0HKB8_9HYPH|nr:ATP-dependent helicase HrpB [Mesorhizobium alhagi]EHK58838.1 ATP-dependent helicase HrpB [Mesorhizobium alhagi CCNWXJ12-2]